MLVLSPECWRQDNQHTEYFQTTDEHHQRAEPFCHIRQFAPRHGWSNFRTQRRSHITHTTQGDSDGIGIVDAHGYHRERYLISLPYSQCNLCGVNPQATEPIGLFV